MNPPPPIPHDCGRATLRPKTMAAAASTALPPRSRTALPICDAATDSVATMPPVLRVAGRYIDPSLAGAIAGASRTHDAPTTATHARPPPRAIARNGTTGPDAPAPHERAGLPAG